ncbi:MAG: BamA/TamA family outer membrane protein [Deltaproteobacteria bacterium]|nr:BamA/TamA family outer membrane protein [Deltaproteobacteria bacterium]
MSVLRLHALLLAITLLLLPAARARGGDPELRWRTLASDHARIHYPDALEDLARRSLDLAEEAHAALAGLLGYGPSEILELTLVDDQDSANGLTWTWPYNLIHLYAFPPLVDEHLGCADDWLRMLVVHEMVHVFHLDRTTGLLRVVNRILGKAVQPNQAWPDWLTEGLAVALETRLTGGGRLRSPRFLQVLRMASLEGTFLDLGELAGTTLKLPRASAPYLYGGFFVSWLLERHGTAWLREAFDRQGRRVVPFSFNALALRAFGATFVELYAKWREGTAAAFAAWRERREDEGLVEGRRLLYAGENSPRPRFADDGSLLYVDSDPRRRTRLRRLLPGGRVEDVIPCPSGCGHPAQDGEGAVWFLSGDLWQNEYWFKDLWRVLDGRRERRSERLRCRDLALHPPSGRGACVSSDAGGTRIEVFDLETLDRRVVAEAPPGGVTILGQPEFTPDGGHLVFVWRQGTASDLREVDLSTGTLTALTVDGAWNTDPAVHPGGRWVVFSRAEDGALDLFALDRRAPGPPLRLTRVLGGAHQATFSPAGDRVVYASYHADGYHLVELPFRPPAGSAPGPTREVVPAPSAPVVPEPVARSASFPYLPFLHLRPRSWVPRVTVESTGVTSWGLELDAADPARLHAAWASFYHYPVSDDLAASFQWTVDVGWPLVSLAASVFRNHRMAFRADAWHDYDELEGLVSAGVVMPLHLQHRTVTWSASWSLDLFRGELPEGTPPHDPGASQPWQPLAGRQASLTTGFSYNDVERYGRSIGGERGLNLALSMRFSAPFLGSQWTEHRLRVSGAWYQPFFWPQHTLVIRYQAGIAGGETRVRSQFSLGGYPTQDYLRDLLENSGISGTFLRGFVAGAFAGTTFQYAALDYRFPLWRIRRGYQTWPVFLEDLSGTVFVNAGYAASGFQPLSHGGIGTGAELSLGVLLASYQPLTLTLGYASGFGDGGGHGVYFLLGP